MSFLPDIIQSQVIDRLPLVIEVSNIDDKVLSVSYTYFLREGSVIKDDNDVSFTVASFVAGESITVTESGFVGDIHCRKPEFMWGTQLNTNREYLSKSNRSEDKLPMIWLIDPWQEDGYPEGSSKDYSARCTFFFLDTVRPNDLNEDLSREAQMPMFNLSDIFLNTLNANIEYFNIVNDKQRRPRTRFGTETEKGTNGTTIDDLLTGCEYQMTIDVNKVDDNCPFVTPNIPIYVCAAGLAVNTDGSYSLSVPSGGEAIIPDMTITVNYGGTSTDFDIVTLGNNEINLIFT